MSDAVRDRVLRRQGRIPAHQSIAAQRTALVVVDMQNYFCAPGFPAEVAASRATVPAINRMAQALREAGGCVAWVQTTARGATERWARHHQFMLEPGRVQARLAKLAEDSEGFRLFPELDSQPSDLFARKIMYSAFINGSSDLHEQLGRRGIESLLVAGTATNVCCESTARDAMMLDYRVVMLSDANSAFTQEEHATSLDNFALFFGDVMSVDEAIGRLAR
ncbi:MAG: cysteine hydrolase [Betaproteobacteria bacterium]|nr:cysteine hydrolase [Betaproteobacteria bacterium]